MAKIAKTHRERVKTLSAQKMDQIRQRGRRPDAASMRCSQSSGELPSASRAPPAARKFLGGFPSVAMHDHPFFGGMSIDWVYRALNGPDNEGVSSCQGNICASSMSPLAGSIKMRLMRLRIRLSVCIGPLRLQMGQPLLTHPFRTHPFQTHSFRTFRFNGTSNTYVPGQRHLSQIATFWTFRN